MWNLGEPLVASALPVIPLTVKSTGFFTQHSYSLFNFSSVCEHTTLFISQPPFPTPPSTNSPAFILTLLTCKAFPNALHRKRNANGAIHTIQKPAFKCRQLGHLVEPLKHFDPRIEEMQGFGSAFVVLSSVKWKERVHNARNVVGCENVGNTTRVVRSGVDKQGTRIVTIDENRGGIVVVVDNGETSGEGMEKVESGRKCGFDDWDVYVGGSHMEKYEERHSTRVSLLDLHESILDCIVNRLPPHDLYKMSHVCTSLRNMS
ncbi:F-box protein [Senna tora]|uniref:F-box protein n=1 Tax=Senna tora TaxID=362788 RepID=A0A834U2M3_9FABA|nr:F-box protein [Senna tora]